MVAMVRSLAANICCLMTVAALFTASAFAQDNADQLGRGEEVFNTWCLACHDANLPWSGGGTQALDAKYNGEKPGNLLERTDLTPEVVKTFVRTGLFRMPPFRLTEIDDEELEDLAAFLSRNLETR